MRKILAGVCSAAFFVIAPGFVVGLAPWWITHWRVRAPFLATPLSHFAGAVLLALGVIGLIDSFVRFAVKGLGTPAPVFPTQRLVVTGLYRYVRNPMYVSVVTAILGQALIFGNATLLAYAALVWFLCHLFVLIYEEPVLARTFGSDYQTYRGAVPRWIPRLTPWAPESAPER